MILRRKRVIVLLFMMAAVSSQNSSSLCAQDTDQTSVQVGKKQPLKVTARFHVEKGTNKGYLIIKANVPKDSYIYGLGQTGVIPPSKFTVAKTKSFRTKGAFRAEKAPKIIEKDPVFKARLEKHYGPTQFYIPMEFATSANHSQLKPVVVFDGQMCSDKGYCVQIRKMKILARFAGYFDRQAAKPPLPKTKNRR